MKVHFFSSCLLGLMRRKTIGEKIKAFKSAPLWIHTFRSFTFCHQDILIFPFLLLHTRRHFGNKQKANFTVKRTEFNFNIYFFSKTKCSSSSLAVLFYFLSMKGLGRVAEIAGLSCLLNPCSFFFSPVAFYICCSPEIWVLDCREVKYYTLSLPASFPGGVKTCSCSKVRTLQGSRVWLAVLFLHWHAVGACWEEKLALFRGWFSRSQNK